MRWTPMVLALTVSAALTAVPASPAAAAGTTRLVLTVRPAGQPKVRVWLGCGPVRGTHPAAREACAALARVRGEVSALPADSSLCFAIYAPVVATASGTWRGRPVWYRQTFGNDCELQRQTGVVFAIRRV